MSSSVRNRLLVSVSLFGLFLAIFIGSIFFASLSMPSAKNTSSSSFELQTSTQNSMLFGESNLSSTQADSSVSSIPQSDSHSQQKVLSNSAKNDSVLSQTLANQTSSDAQNASLLQNSSSNQSSPPASNSSQPTSLPTALSPPAALSPSSNTITLSNSGAYRLSEDTARTSPTAIIISADNITLDGNGHEVYGAINLADVTGVTLQNMVIDPQYGLILNGTSHSNFINLTFANITSKGLWFLNSAHSNQFLGLGISLASGTAIDMSDGYDNVINCQGGVIDGPSNSTAIAISNSSFNNTIMNCVIRGFGDLGANNSSVNDSGSNTTNSGNSTGNSSTNSTNSNSTSNNSSANTTLSHNISSCMNISEPNSHWTIVNDFSVAGTPSGPTFCIYADAENVSIDGNGHHVNGTPATIFLYSEHQGLVLENASISSFALAVTTQHSPNSIIRNNRLENFTSFAVSMEEQSDNCIISNNSISAQSADYAAISVQDSQNCVVSSNVLAASSIGILLYYGSNHLVTLNVVNSSSDSIQINHSSANVLTYNNLTPSSSANALELDADSSQNLIHHNRFLAGALYVLNMGTQNKFDIAVNGSYNANYSDQGNYYANINQTYIYDTNGDGYGDFNTPYGAANSLGKWSGNGWDYGPIGAAPPPAQTRVISACTIIREPNSYWTIAGDLSFPTDSNACISVEAENVTINGAGHHVLGNPGLIFLYSDQAGTIIENASISNFIYGVLIQNAPNSAIRNNHLENFSGSAILLQVSSDNSIVSNNYISSPGSDFAAILVKNSGNHNISNNNIAASNAGIRLYNSSGNVLSYNNLTPADSANALEMDADSSQNLIHHNRFLAGALYIQNLGSGNKFEIAVNSSYNGNYSDQGNYYANINQTYIYDHNGDGYGDFNTPYCAANSIGKWSGDGGDWGPKMSS